MYRIIHMPTRLHNAKSRKVGLKTFAARDSKPKKGMANTRTTDVTVTHTQGGSRRRRMKNVSSPMLPYQITRYWPKVRYPQNAVKANISLPMSWKCRSSIRPSAVFRNRFHDSTITPKSERAHSQAPMKNHQLYRVLWKWSESPIDRSHESTDQPKAKRSTVHTASFPCSECVE